MTFDAKNHTALDNHTAFGVTGLVDYVLSHRPGRSRTLALGRAVYVLKTRGYREKATDAFKRAVIATRDLREEMLRREVR